MLRKTFETEPVDLREEREKDFEHDDPRLQKKPLHKEDLDTLDGWTDDSNQRS